MWYAQLEFELQIGHWEALPDEEKLAAFSVKQKRRLWFAQPKDHHRLKNPMPQDAAPKSAVLLPPPPPDTPCKYWMRGWCAREESAFYPPNKLGEVIVPAQ